MSEFRAPRVMGIINCTPDSFFSGSRSGTTDSALKIARAMIRDGADILDIGGESTRPGSSGVDTAEQIRRVIPVIRRIREESNIRISVDTRDSPVAEAALDEGADIINDVSALYADAGMATLAAERQVPVVLMHMQGNPENMQVNPGYQNVCEDVREGLQQAVDRARAAGIRDENIILDPGIGFGKRLADNTALLGDPHRWLPGEYPVLIGLSRKSFLGLILDAGPAESPENGPEDRMVATVAAHAWCLTQGVDILRVHDVRETRQLLSVWEALSWAS